MTADHDIDDAAIARERAGRIADRMLAVMRSLLIAIDRDHERCGKAACARSRRCRGFACEPDDAVAARS